VAARDGGGRESGCVVVVSIEDENDNAPRFPMVEYRVSVSEATAPVVLLTLQVRGQQSFIFCMCFYIDLRKVQNHG
jgi:hypothetical protein